MEQCLDAIEWRRSAGLVPYRAALAEQEARNAAIADARAAELVWLLEHPPVYTAGPSAARARRAPVRPRARRLGDRHARDVRRRCLGGARADRHLDARPRRLGSQ